MTPLADGPLATTRGGSGEPLVLIHGLGSSRTVWDRTRVPLERRFDVIAIDLPGFGDQPAPPDGPARRMDDMASAAERELDRLGIERPYVVGNSMGGWVALELGRRGRAREVIAISPAGGSARGEGRLSSLKLRGARVASRLLAPVIGPLSRFRLARSVGYGLVAANPGDITPGDAVQAARHMAGATGFRALVGDVAFGDNLIERSRERFSGIECPVLIVWGEDEAVYPAAGGARLADAIPGADLLAPGGIGHSPMLDRPDFVAELILGRL